MTQETAQATAVLSRSADDTLLVSLAGDWKVGCLLPSTEEVRRQIETETPPKGLVFEAKGLMGWDSALLTFLMFIITRGAEKGIRVERAGLPEGVQRLLALATAVPERKGARRIAVRVPYLERIGELAIGAWRRNDEMLRFIGEVIEAWIKMVTGRASFRWSDVFLQMQLAGAQALPIVSLISLLVGLILAYVGAIQLKIFGAQIYVASLVGIGMVRALAAIMTGIIMAGRTGASYAAEIGTMQVNEEIDALRTLGIQPVEFLVLPRMLALSVMMPLLCLYANLMGVLGGLVVGVFVLDLNPMEYFYKTQESVRLNDLWVGLFSGAVFGVLVALAGCVRGMQCGRSASAVGQATTSAVVTSIVTIIVATAIITVMADILGI